MKKISFEEAIKYLNEGKKIIENEEYEVWKDDEGILRQKHIESGDLFYNSDLKSFNRYYLPEEPKPFEITKTGLYKTRDSSQAYVSYIGGQPKDFYNCCYLINGFGNTVYCNIKGRRYNKESSFDIVSEWSDEDA